MPAATPSVLVPLHSSQAIDGALKGAGMRVAECLMHACGAPMREPYVGQYRSDGQHFFGTMIEPATGLSSYLAARDEAFSFAELDDCLRLQVIPGPVSALLSDRPAWLPPHVFDDPLGVLTLVDLFQGGYSATVYRIPAWSARTPLHAGTWALPKDVARAECGLPISLASAYGVERGRDADSFEGALRAVRPPWELPFLELLAAAAILRETNVEARAAQVRAVHPGGFRFGERDAEFPLVELADAKGVKYLELTAADMRLVARFYGPGIKAYGDCRGCAGRGWLLELRDERAAANLSRVLAPTNELRTCARCLGDGRDREPARAASSLYRRMLVPEFQLATPARPEPTKRREADPRFSLRPMKPH